MNVYARLFICCVLCLSIFATCSQKIKPLQGRYYSGLLFGKPYSIDVVGDSTDYQMLVDSIVRVFAFNFDVNNPTSIISRYNAFERTDTVFKFQDTSAVFGLVYDLSRDLNSHTMQYYDPTINPLKRAWMMARLNGMAEPNLDSLYKFVGFDGAKMDLTEITDSNYAYIESHLRKADPRIEADFTTLAAALALDHIGEMFKAKNVSQFKINYGHSVITYGYLVDSLNVIPMGIANDSTDQLIRLNNHAFSYATAEEKLTMVDPTYGYPVENEMAYVAVAAPTLVEAAIFSEAFMTMGFDKATEYYNKNEESKIQSFMFYNEQQMLRNASTEGFDQLLIPVDSTLH